MTPEGKVKAAVKKILESFKQFGLWYYMPVQAGYGRMGIPDFIICCAGKFIAIECKAEAGMTTALQRETLLQIANAGGGALVIYPEDVNTLAAHLNMILSR